MYFVPLMIIVISSMLVIKVGDIIQASSMVDNKFLSLISAAEAEQVEVDTKNNATTERGKDDHSGIKLIDKAIEEKSVKLADSKPNDCVNKYTTNELEILQNLSKRRQELEVWNKDLQDKENIIRASEERIQQKLGELKKLQNDLKIMLAEYNNKQDDKIQSLVKIYENMKPKDAAKIFEQLDMRILLDVVHRMKEAKSAPIIALMDPLKAKDLTTEFAKQKKYAQPL